MSRPLPGRPGHRGPGPVLALCLFLAGCAGGRGGFTPLPPPADGRGLVYLYREAFPKQRSGGTILVDKREVAGLARHEYTYFYLEPGPHVIEAVWQGLTATSIRTPLTLEVEAGRTYYVTFEKGRDERPCMGVPLSGIVTSHCASTNTGRTVDRTGAGGEREIEDNVLAKKRKEKKKKRAGKRAR